MKNVEALRLGGAVMDRHALAAIVVVARGVRWRRVARPPLAEFVLLVLFGAETSQSTRLVRLEMALRTGLRRYNVDISLVEGLTREDRIDTGEGANDAAESGNGQTQLDHVDTIGLESTVQNCAVCTV